MNRAEILARLRTICYNDADPMTLDGWQTDAAAQALTTEQLRTILTILDDGGAEFVSDMVGNDTRGHCFMLDALARYLRLNPTARNPLTGRIITPRQRRDIFDAYARVYPPPPGPPPATGGWMTSVRAARAAQESDDEEEEEINDDTPFGWFGLAAVDPNPPRLLLFAPPVGMAMQDSDDEDEEDDSDDQGGHPYPDVPDALHVLQQVYGNAALPADNIISNDEARDHLNNVRDVMLSESLSADNLPDLDELWWRHRVIQLGLVDQLFGSLAPDFHARGAMLAGLAPSPPTPATPQLVLVRLMYGDDVVPAHYPSWAADHIVNHRLFEDLPSFGQGQRWAYRVLRYWHEYRLREMGLGEVIQRHQREYIPVATLLGPLMQP
jgi:hypothetical protein